jgi:hypothetical protein
LEKVEAHRRKLKEDEIRAEKEAQELGDQRERRVREYGVYRGHKTEGAQR